MSRYDAQKSKCVTEVPVGQLSLHPSNGTTVCMGLLPTCSNRNIQPATADAPKSQNKPELQFKSTLHELQAHISY
jgi:hypothetical protein